MTTQNQDPLDSKQSTLTYFELCGLRDDPFEAPLHFLVDADEGVIASIINVLADADKTVLLAASSESDRRRMLDKILLRMLPAATCRITASLMMNEWELLLRLAATMQLPTTGKDLAGLEQELVSLLTGKPAEVNDLLCVVEDAQLLSESLIVYLIQFVHDHKLRLILSSASTENFVRFDDHDLLRWQIPTFTPALTRQYLDQRFRQAGSSVPEVFSDQVVAWICNESRGEQHLIDQAALRVLQNIKFERAAMNKGDYLKWTLVIGAVLVLFPGVYLLNSAAIFSSPAAPGGAEAPTLVEAPAKIAPGVPFKIADANDNPPEEAQAAKLNAEKEVAMEIVEHSAPKPKVVSPASEAKDEKLPYPLTNAWLTGVNPEFYTIQVMGSHSREKIDRFMESGKLAQGYAWFESSYNGQPWYVVIKGIYQDREAALSEAVEVKKITGLEPWVRSFETINEGR